jgi:glycosyltransferase involved in cell wall biosynthesis
MYKFSIVVPCLNEEKNIEFFSKEIKLLLDGKYNFSILFIDDGSIDDTWNVITNLKKKFPFINGIKLSRNFGKDNAICCGLSNIKDEDFIITIDADLQHPPEKIQEMINLWENNNKIVNTFRINQQENNIREIGSKFFYYIMNKFSDIVILSKTTDFALIDSSVVRQFNQISENNKQFRSLISWLGFKKISIPIKINSRKNDKSKFGLLILIKLAINNFSSFSIFPIKIISYMGIIMSFVTLIISVLIIVNKIFFSNSLLIGNQVILIFVQIFLTGLTLISVGFLGLYINKILNNSNNRPSYIVEKRTD